MGIENDCIPEMFNQIAPCYDVINRLISLSMDALWRRWAMAHTALQPGQRGLDVACGTGKSTVELVRLVSANGYAVGLDLSEKMLLRAKLRIKGSKNVSFIPGDALNLPFPDNSFNAAVMCFALRNMANMDKALKEMERVVKPQGRVVVLDLFDMSSPLLRPLYRFYLNKTIPLVAKAIHGDDKPYKYLAESICQFPSPEKISVLMSQTGLKEVLCKKLWFGAVGLIVGEVK
jgi:demethylmenaquinone methyltransferase/2-methoxy-6-polyprenyl-1,4-benzoquinol methylase